MSGISYHRSTKLGSIKQYTLDRTRMLGRIQTKILNSPARKMERLFNCIPGHLRDITRRPTGYFKKHLDKWLREKVPDQPKCGVYVERLSLSLSLYGIYILNVTLLFILYMGFHLLNALYRVNELSSAIHWVL